MCRSQVRAANGCNSSVRVPTRVSITVEKVVTVPIVFVFAEVELRNEMLAYVCYEYMYVQIQ